MAKTKLGNMIKKAQASFMKSNTSSSLINNRYLLYIILLIVISDLLILGSFGELLYVVIYLLVGLITSFFSKNMVIILMVAMVITNVIKYGSKIRLHEGMANEEEEDEDEAVIREKLSNLSDEQRGLLEAVKNGDQSDLNLSEEEESMFKKMISVMDEEEVTEGMKELKSSTKKSADPKPAPQGKRNLKTIQKETMDVQKKQKELLTSMKSLEPMLNEAQQFMENFKKK